MSDGATLETAIDPHLRRDRRYPTRKGDDFEPAFPAFSTRFPVSTTAVVMAYFGVQYPEGEPPGAAVAALATLRADVDGEQGPKNVDLTTYVDEAGYRNRIVIAYWDDPTLFDAWFTAHPWADADRAGQGVGFFTEIVRPSVERFETLVTSDRLEGSLALSEGVSGPVREHGYWGGARDRLAVAQDDALEPADSPTLSVDGPVRTVRTGVNPCLIRSGQEFAETAGEEREMYLGEVEPQLRAGMDFLRDEGREVGCYVNRYMVVTDEQWRETDKTFGQSWWRSLGDLDTWAESHPTHLAIFRAAMKYLSTMGADAKLRLYHEVTVPYQEEAVFSYVDCHDDTGMLRAV